MKIINAEDWGIYPDGDITEKLCLLIKALKNTFGEKTVIFRQGTYFLDSEKCKKYMITL